jgi:hypothetical protein
MLSYIWDSMLVVLVGGIGWSVVSFVGGILFLGLLSVIVAIFGDKIN